MAEDDLLLDASDLADIFGVDDAKGGDDLAKSIEDLFLSDDDEPSSPGFTMPKETAAPVPAVTASEPEDEPEPQEPDRGGMTEEEWRASSQYAEFKKQVIARHLRKKAAEDLARRAAEEHARIDALDAAERAKHEAAEAEARALRVVEEARQREQQQADQAAQAEAERRRQELLDKYKAAKAATIAQRAQALVSAQDQVEAVQAEAEDEKAAKLKAYLADLKAKMASGGGPPLSLQAKHLAPQLSDAGKGLVLDVPAAKALAAMFEDARSEMLKHVSDAIGKKPAQAMMKKTLAKVAKVHLDVLGRAAVDAKNELRVDGALDEERLARAIYALPEGQRLEKVQKAFYELIEMRFIACELGLGHRQKAVIVSRTLQGLETSFTKKAHPAPLKKWFFDDVIPSTSLADSDDPAF